MREKERERERVEREEEEEGEGEEKRERESERERERERDRWHQDPMRGTLSDTTPTSKAPCRRRIVNSTETSSGSP